MAGHPGVRRTERRVRERFDLGRAFHRRVRQYVRDCEICQRRKPPQQKVGDMQPVVPPGRPFEKVGLDIAGPFNVPGRPPVYILVAVDYCTRFVHLFAAGRISAPFVVRSLEIMSASLGRIGTIVADNASCFRGTLLADYLRRVGTSHIRTAVGHPQCNGLAERTIRTLTDRLGALVLEGFTASRQPSL
ncbi:uncharacterized protein K02A2.6-like [Galendromus occidentalis]|uniref:RNA-directed DNA polymerase n=1 Tax=Galendromus occidentalis TaxID=34638 RepID=A0AAJ7L4C6_9ACAR|nr:uncharacterized protein K02A2.6-like [Galendromus occidentalis]